MHAIVVGAGAAGCFAAIEMKRRYPDLDVTVLEAHSRPLAKVAITGGGRCNLTNSFRQVRSVKSVYPRGEKLMKRALKQFSHSDTMQWFESEGVPLVVQPDECVFPQSQDAMQIVNTLLRLMQSLGVRLLTGQRVTAVEQTPEGYCVATATNTFTAHRLLITTGGSKTPLPFPITLTSTELRTTDCVPSLFTFNTDCAEQHALMGTVVENTTTRLCGTKFQADGPLLITHWGLSGPAILRLSSYAARHLAENHYRAQLSVNWLGDMREPEALQLLQRLATDSPQRQLSNAYPEAFCQRLWLFLLNRAALTAEKRWSEVGPRQMNRLAALLTADVYDITGRGQFKDEFVTCGGISLDNLDPNTLQCRQAPGLFFAGEVLDIDALTGGFNLQAAWTTAYIAATAIGQ